MLPRCSQDAPNASKMHPKLCQDAAKMRPRCPTCPKIVPRCSQDAPPTVPPGRGHPGGTVGGEPRRTEIVPNILKCCQNASKMVPRCSQDAPKASKMHPELCQDAAKMLPRCLHAAQHAPRLSRGAPKMFLRLPRCSQDASKADFGTQKGPKMVPTRSQNDTKSDTPLGLKMASTLTKSMQNPRKEKHDSTAKSMTAN